MRFGIIGSGSWATALAKILTDNGNAIHWWVRNADTIQYIQKRKHNPHYLSAAYFNQAQLQLTNDLQALVSAVDVIVVAVPSAYVSSIFEGVDASLLEGKKIVSAVKGILPDHNVLLNQYLQTNFNFPLDHYFTLLGPCHAEEVAAEKLSYLTFSGTTHESAQEIASHFNCDYINTLVNTDIYGSQFASVLKNIYALGAGIAHGLEYGDNFLSVYIANCANEMANFLQKCEHPEGATKAAVPPNYNASVYLGDLLVTCYSLYSRNRTFGNMIGKGYSVKAAQLELNMVAEGYNASKCIYEINQAYGAEMPIATAIYQILWKQVHAANGFGEVEKILF
jgi:glycerol-3-phosphate dehydrogenase (NAD(P)+)